MTFLLKSFDAQRMEANETGLFAQCGTAFCSMYMLNGVLKKIRGKTIFSLISVGILFRRLQKCDGGNIASGGKLLVSKARGQ
jgi:hypothetical protein